MSEQTNIYSNAVLSSTLDGMYRGLSGLYDVAVSQKAKLAQQTSAREAGDLALSAAISAAVEDITSNLTQSDTVVGELSTALSTAIDTEASARATGDSQALSSAKKYTDDKLVEYYTAAQADAISAAIEQAYKAADSDLSSAIDAINAKTISGENAVAVSTVEGATTVSLNINAASAILSQDASGLKTTIALQKITTGLAENIESEYALVGLNGVELGERIQVTKDRFLSGVQYIPSSQTLQFAFKLADGTTQISPVDIGSLVDTYTAGDGVTIENNVVTVKKDATSEDFLKVTSAGVAVTGVSAAIADAVTPVDTRVQAIESAIPVSSVTSGAILVEKDGKIVLNDNYNPGIALQFNGKNLGSGITSLNFAGTTTITVDGGIAKVQIGDNMNSSIFGEKANSKAADGNNGTVSNTAGTLSTILIPDATGAAFKVGDWTAGSSKTVGTKATSIEVKTGGWIHFDQGQSKWTVTVYGESASDIIAQAQITTDTQFNADGTFKAIAKETTYIVGSTGISLALSNEAREDNYPSAVGARAKVTFTVNVATLVPNGGRFSIQVVPPVGTTYKTSEMFRLTGATPKIGAITLTDVTESYGTATYSGVTYITTANFKAEIDGISGIWNQAAVANTLTSTGVTGLTGVDTNVAATTLVSSKVWNEAAGKYTDSGISLTSNFAGTSVIVNYNVKNAYGNVTGTAATISNYNFNNKGTTTTSDSVQSFVNESRRLTNDTLVTYDSSDSLVDNTELQVVPGSGLVYPTVNYSAYAKPTENPNYSTCSGTRYFARRMKAGSGTVFGGTLTLAGLGANWSNLSFAKLSIDNGSTWFNLKADRGGADATGILNSYTQNTGAISFSFPGTTSMTATDGVVIKLGWSNTSVKITSITLSM